jgi:hypothetical protein
MNRKMSQTRPELLHSRFAAMPIPRRSRPKAGGHLVNVCIGSTTPARPLRPRKRSYLPILELPRRQLLAMPPSLPRVSPRSRASACGLVMAEGEASTSTAFLPARRWTGRCGRQRGRRRERRKPRRSTVRDAAGRKQDERGRRSAVVSLAPKKRLFLNVRRKRLLVSPFGKKFCDIN